MDVGSIAAAAWIARLVFVVLVIQALMEGKRGVAIVAVVFGLAARLLLPRVNPQLVTPGLAIVDIGLILAVLGRDIRLN